MKLKIVTLTGVTIQLEHPQKVQMTVAGIKAELEKQIGFPREHVSLVFRGKELVGEGLEQKSIRKLYPDYTSSKDFFVLVFRRTARHKKDGNDRKRKAEESGNSGVNDKKHHKTTSSSSSGSIRRNSSISSNKRGTNAESKSSSSPSRPQLSNIHEMRDFLRKFGERRQMAKAQASTRTTIEPKGEFLSQLTNMGFKSEAATRALLLHRNNLEMALNWLLENASDPDINNPISSKERQQLSRVASRPAIPMEALNDFIEINFGADRVPSPSYEPFTEGEGNNMDEEEEESAAAVISAVSRAAERTGGAAPSTSAADPENDSSLM